MTDLPDGWLSAADVKELARLAKSQTVLELGAYKGRSTVVLSEHAKYVISVDRHQGVNYPEDTFTDYLLAVRELPNVAIVVARFEDFVPYIWNMEMVFIDGDHDYNSVKRDIQLALDLDTLVIVFHDWDFDEVRAAARPYFLGEPDALSGSIASFKR